MAAPGEDTLRIIPAAPDMAPVASTLIHMTMGRMADYLFSSGDPQRAQDMLGRLFRLGSNRFSYRYTEVAALPGGTAGMLISYAGRAMRTLDMPMALELMQDTGLRGFVRFIGRALPLVGIPEAEDDEYFISNVAVVPQCRGRGIGSQLLARAEGIAREQRFTKLALTVDVENERARALYLRAGFEVVRTVRVETLRKRFGYAGFHRMVKGLR